MWLQVKVFKQFTQNTEEKIINGIKERGMKVPVIPYCLGFCGSVHVQMENMCILVGDSKKY